MQKLISNLVAPIRQTLLAGAVVVPATLGFGIDGNGAAIAFPTASAPAHSTKHGDQRPTRQAVAGIVAPITTLANEFDEAQATAGGLDIHAGLAHTVIDLSAIAPDELVDIRAGDAGEGGTFSVIFERHSPQLITVKSNLTLKERRLNALPAITNIVAVSRSGKIWMFNVLSDDNLRGRRYTLKFSEPALGLRPPAAPQGISQSNQPRYANREQELLDRLTQAEADRLQSAQNRQAHETAAADATREAEQMRRNLTEAARSLQSGDRSQSPGKQTQALLDQQAARAEQLRQQAQEARVQEEALAIRAEDLRQQLRAAPQPVMNWQQWVEAARSGLDPAAYGYTARSQPPQNLDPQQVQLVEEAYRRYHPATSMEAQP
ncbi:hypothetical protein [Gloeobacter kilaueensis]|nr:hypothetical protein [Gloeobacter kilaueensis]